MNSLVLSLLYGPTLTSIHDYWKNHDFDHTDLQGFSGDSVVKNLSATSGYTGQEDPLEKEMKAHSSTLAWEILWTEDPGWLQSMGLQNSQTRLND